MSAEAAGLLLIRIVVGLLFAGHGLQKLLGWFGGGGLRATASMFDRGGLGPGRVTAPLGGAAELGGGLSLALGLLTPVGAIAVLVMMAGAVVAVHGRNGLWNTNGGSEYNLVLGAIALALTLIGPGRWSVDHVIGWRLFGWRWAAAAIVVTLVAAVIEMALIRAHRVGQARSAPQRVAQERDSDAVA
ncbi:MAG: DoxX family protein [Actinomycetota bacterium]